MTFAALEAELDRWSSAGQRATLWWRDDDACAATPALRTMLDIARVHALPIALAVIPQRLASDLVHAVSTSRLCTVLQHGYAHINHAPASERSCELGTHRNPVAVAEELESGRERLRSLFLDAFLPVLVPPWNRIASALIPRLPSLGYRGLSTFAPRSSATPVPRLVQCNTHIDPIAWRSGRRFVGEDAAAGRIATHLAQRRERRVDADEPTGLLTHHLDFDADAWRFVATLLEQTLRHPAVDWIAAEAAFSDAEATSARSA